VKAVIEVPEANLARISNKNKSYITAAGLSEPIKGQVTLISPVVKPTSRTATVEISIDNSTHKIRPGVFATVSIPLEVHNDVLLISRSAVVEVKQDNKVISNYVYIVENGKAIKREVGIGIAQGDILEVLSGVQAGEKIIVAGQNQVKDNTKVKVAGVIE
jgi:RND family efflux transporter MFP subunit